MQDVAPNPEAATRTGVPLVGVLAIQGAFAEHVAALDRCGARTREVRAAGDLDELDALVIPGGESTAIRKGLERTGTLTRTRELVAGGLPTLGTCAGLIVLATPEPDGAPAGFGLLDVEVARNGFGSQVHSFEQAVRIDTQRSAAASASHDTTNAAACTLPGIFIRAPRLGRLGEAVTPIAWIAGGLHDGEVVAVRQGAMLAATFHPELTDDTTLHELLLALVEERAASPRVPRTHVG